MTRAEPAPFREGYPTPATLTVRDFKRFGEVEVELENPVAFIGPNNSGKISAMRAPSLSMARRRRLRRTP